MVARWDNVKDCPNFAEIEISVLKKLLNVLNPHSPGDLVAVEIEEIPEPQRCFVLLFSSFLLFPPSFSFPSPFEFFFFFNPSQKIKDNCIQMINGNKRHFGSQFIVELRGAYPHLTKWRFVVVVVVVVVVVMH